MDTALVSFPHDIRLSGATLLLSSPVQLFSSLLVLMAGEAVFGFVFDLLTRRPRSRCNFTPGEQRLKEAEWNRPGPVEWRSAPARPPRKAPSSPIQPPLLW